MNLLKLFRRNRPEMRETALQATLWDRTAMQAPGPPPDGLPPTVLEAMEKDSMVQTCLTVKRLGVLAVPYRLEPCGIPERDRFVAECFERMEGSPATVLSAAMDAFAKGWSVQELLYLEEQGRIWLQAVVPKDPSLLGLQISPFGRIEGLVLEVPGEERRELPLDKFVVYRHRSSYGRHKGRSDLVAAHSHYQAKQTLIRNWNTYLRKFAVPTMMAKCGAQTSEQDRDSLLQALKSLETKSSLVVTPEVEIEALGASRDASSTFIDALDFHNREIARAILGQTLATDEGRRVGSLAMGKVHLQVLTLQLEAIRRELADVVMTEQVVRPLVEMNFGPGPIPRFAFEPVPLTAFTTGQL